MTQNYNYLKYQYWMACMGVENCQGLSWALGHTNISNQTCFCIVQRYEVFAVMSLQDNCT